MTTKISALLLAGAVSISTARAIELLDFVALPDAGFGSYAAARFELTIDGHSLAVVGEKTNSLGRDLPMYWKVDDAGHVVAYNQLPVPNGFEGEALDGTQYPNGDVIVVGNIADAQGKERAVLWRKPLLGSWSAPVQLFPGAQQSRMARADYCGDGTAHLLAGCSVQNNNLWSPLAIYIPSTGLWFSRNLPLGMGGTQGRAIGADGSDGVGENSSICGDNVLPAVQNVANFWNGGTAGFTSHTLPHWDGFMGAALDVRNDSSLTILCGEYHNDLGQTRAFRSNGSNLIRLLPLSGFGNASADSFWLGSNDALGAAVVVGTSGNPVGDQVATAWIFNSGDPTNYINFLADPSSLSKILRCRADDSEPGTVGEIVLNGGQFGRAAAFETTDTHVPDAMKIVVGTPYGTQRVANLWHNDGAYNRISTKLVNNVMTLTVDFTFYPMNKRAWTSGSFHLLGRTLGTGIMGTLKVYQRNESNLGFRLMKTVHIGNAAMAVDGALPSPLSTYYNAATGAMHMRLVYTGDTNAVQSFVIEHLEDLIT